MTAPGWTSTRSSFLEFLTVSAVQQPVSSVFVVFVLHCFEVGNLKTYGIKTRVEGLALCFSGQAIIKYFLANAILLPHVYTECVTKCDPASLQGVW